MADPPLRIYDEGGLLGPVFKLDFAGSGVVATRNGITGTITIAGGGGAFLPLAGGTLTGDVYFPVTGFIMVDSDGVQWRVTIDTLGSIVTTQIITTGDLALLETGDDILLETSDKLLLES